MHAWNALLFFSAKQIWKNPILLIRTIRSEGFSDLPKAIKLVNMGAGIQTQVYMAQISTFFSISGWKFFLLFIMERVSFISRILFSSLLHRPTRSRSWIPPVLRGWPWSPSPYSLLPICSQLNPIPLSLFLSGFLVRAWFFSLDLGSRKEVTSFGI